MKQQQYPVVVRVPGTRVVETGKTFPTDYSDINKYAVDKQGTEVAVIAAGSFYQLGEAVVDKLAGQGINATLINPRYLSRTRRGAT